MQRQIHRRATQVEPVRRKKNKSKGNYFDYGLLAVIIFLVCFGLVMLYSASAYSALIQSGDSMFYFKRQILFSIVGFGVIFIVSKFDYHVYAKYAKYIYGLAVFLMVLVQTPLGKEVNGAKRWIKLPFDQTLQPSELAKIAVILFIPVLICKMGKEINSLKGMVRVFMWGGFSAACVYFFTENLSTAIIVLGISCVLIFVVHPKTAPFVVLAGASLVALVISVQVLIRMVDTSDNFRMRRIIAWLAPEQHASDNAFQTVQGLYAIGSGGLFGKGLGNSAQKMVIPEVQNDMILAIICEELGVFGTAIVLVLFGLLLFRLMFIAQNAPDLYGALIVSGIFAHIAIQVVLNVAVVTNLIPTTGITLPFISYGGTSVLFLMVEMGIALGVSKTIRLDE